MTDTFLHVQGRQVRVLKSPSPQASGARPQLLVRCLGGSAAIWVQVMEGLSQHGPVVAVDLPGFGRTPIDEDDALTVHGYVDFVLEVADTLSWERFTLHRNSMGGLIGTHLAADHPHRIDRLVLVSPALPPGSPFDLLRPSRVTVTGMLPVMVSSYNALTLEVVGLAGPGLDARSTRAMLALIYADPDTVAPALLDLMAADFAKDIEGLDRRRALLAAACSISALSGQSPKHLASNQ